VPARLLALDTTKWATFWYSATTGVDGLSTPAQNVTESGGNLILTRSDSKNGAMVSTRPGASGAPYVGFSLGTESIFEARILFPGNGTQIYNWPAFWVLHDEGEPNPPTVEIDVFDMWQPHPQSAYLVNYPTYGNGGPACNLTQPCTDKYYGDQFHVWTVHRGPSYIDVYIDGVLRWHQAVNSDDPNTRPTPRNTSKSTSAHPHRVDRQSPAPHRRYWSTMCARGRRNDRPCPLLRQSRVAATAVDTGWSAEREEPIARPMMFGIASSCHSHRVGALQL
jgi:hypothetical protein